MELSQTIKQRRAYRALEPVDINEQLIDNLALHAQLAPSCFNKQPWRYVFVYEKEKLDQTKEALNQGNAWAKEASMIIAVFSHKELDCIVKGREYYLFDTGMATANLILRATDLGLVAHPIAGFDEEKVKQVLSLPEEMQVITLVIVGKHAGQPTPEMSEQQIQSEQQRPERHELNSFAYYNSYSPD